MSPLAVSALVALAFGVILVRRRSVATMLVAGQALILGVGALLLARGHTSDFVLAGVVLLVRAFALPALLAFVRRRTPESGLVTAATPVVVRLIMATVISIVAIASIPPLGFSDLAAEHGAIALVALGIAIVVMRRPALFQVLGILVAENGVYLLAISAPEGLPFVIELGALFDLALIITVAAAFTQKIHEEVGTGNTELLRGLRD